MADGGWRMADRIGGKFLTNEITPAPAGRNGGREDYDAI